MGIINALFSIAYLESPVVERMDSSNKKDLPAGLRVLTGTLDFFKKSTRKVFMALQ
jgi:hypothetical protein